MTKLVRRSEWRLTSRRRWMAGLVAAAFLLLAVAALAAGVRTPVEAQSPISVSASSVKITFPSAMVFNIEAKSASEIRDIRLRYRVDRMNYAQVVSESWPKFTPSTSVRTQWTWDMRKSSLPPASAVEYWWALSNAAGDRYEASKQTAKFDDTRYQWRNIVDRQLTLFWYDGAESFARSLMDGAQSGLLRLHQDTGARLDRPVKLFIYGSTKDLQGAMIFPREWTGGVAYGEYGTILIGISTRQLEWGKRASVHELGHMVVNQLTFSPYSTTLPVWLNEGLAMYAEGDLETYYKARLDAAVAANKTISLRSLSSPFSAIAAQAELSYAESQSVVEFLIKRYGKGRLVDLLTAFKVGTTPDEALGKLYGLNQDSLYQAWLASLTGAKGQTATVPGKTP